LNELPGASTRSGSLGVFPDPKELVSSGCSDSVMTSPMSELPKFVPVDNINPRNTRRALLDVWRSRLGGRPPRLLALDIWRALRPCYEAKIEGQLSDQQGHVLVDAHCRAHGLSEDEADRLHRLRQHLNQMSHTQDDQAWTILSSMRLEQWEFLLTSLLDLLGTPLSEDELPRLLSWVESIKQATWKDGSSCGSIDFSFPVCIRREDENLTRLDALRALRPLLESIVNASVSASEVWQDYASSRRAPEMASIACKLQKLERDYRKDRDHFRKVWRYLSHYAVHKTDAEAVPVRSESWETSFLRIYELTILLASQEPKVQLKNFLRDLRDRSFLDSKSHSVEVEIFPIIKADLIPPTEDNVLDLTISQPAELEPAELEPEEVTASEREERFPESSLVKSDQSEAAGSEIPEPPSTEEPIEIQPLHPPENANEMPLVVVSETDDEELDPLALGVEQVLEATMEETAGPEFNTIVWDVSIRHLELTLLEDSLDIENHIDLVGENAEMQVCRVRIPKHFYNAQMPCPLRRGDVLSIHHLQGSSEYPHSAMAGDKTMLVLAPDLMFGPRDIAESIDKPRWRFFADKLKASESHNPNMRSGSALNDVIDLALQSDMDHDEVVEQVVNSDKYQDLAGELRQKLAHPRVRANVKALTQIRRGKKTQIEATWFSPRLGIEGRTDLIDEDGTIIEIKLNADPLDKYPDDRYSKAAKQRLQLACYGMVMEDVAGSIPPMKMFFAMSTDPDRDFNLTSADRDTVLKARNQLAHQLIASDQFIGSSLEGARKETPGNFDDHLTWLQNKEQNSFKDSLWAAMSAHTLREAMAQWLGHGTSLGARTRLSLWRHGAEHKRQSGDLLDGLRLIHVDEKRINATFSLPDTEALADNFRDGDTCTLVPAVISHSLVWHRPLLRGRITQRNHDEIRLSFMNPISAAFPLEIGEAYRIEPSQASSHVWQAVGTHRFLLSCPRDYLAVLSGFNPSGARTDFVSLDPSWLLDHDGNSLAGDQVDAINNAIAAKHLHLIQGPPGSGKTSTILTRLVAHEILHGGWTHPCFVLTLSNRAADEVHEKLEKFFIDREVKVKAHRLSSSDKSRCMGKFSLDRSHVVVCTINSFAAIADEVQAALGSSPYEPFSSTLFVDEASQLKDSDLLGNMARFARVILIGDQCQLPPITALHPERIADASQEMRESLNQALKHATELSFQSLGESTFARLARVSAKQGGQMLSQLATHYRMHCSIAECITHAYDKPLVSAHRRQKSEPSHKIIAGCRLLWLASDGHTDGKTHPQEVNRVIQISKLLLKQWKSEEIGIITPWRSQVAQIRQALHESGLPEIEADTIDRFQGSEKEVIIFSVAVGDSQPLGNATSIMEERPDVDRKLLVALSRAKEQLIVLAHRPSVLPNAAWMQSLSYFETRDFDMIFK
jgi:DNA replication ATP-dependent helicase Dna2